MVKLSNDQLRISTTGFTGVFSMIGIMFYGMLLRYTLTSLSIILLYFTPIPWMIYSLAFAPEIELGGVYMIIPLMTAELLWQRIPEHVMGIILASDVVAGSVFPLVIGAVMDNAKIYNSSFNILIIMAAALGAFAILFYLLNLLCRNE